MRSRVVFPITWLFPDIWSKCQIFFQQSWQLPLLDCLFKCAEKYRSCNSVVQSQNDISSGDKSQQEAWQFKYSISGVQEGLQILLQTDRDNLHNGHRTIVFFCLKVWFFSFPLALKKKTITEHFHKQFLSLVIVIIMQLINMFEFSLFSGPHW